MPKKKKKSKPFKITNGYGIYMMIGYRYMHSFEYYMMGVYE